MRIQADDALSTTPAPADPTVPDVSVLRGDLAGALASFFATVERVQQANPVDGARLQQLAAARGAGTLGNGEAEELARLTAAAIRQGRAVGAVLGFFLKLKPYPMLQEVRARAPVFQPPFGPVLVADGDAVRDVLSRHDEFTVEPYGTEMRKVMTPAHNGGFDTFVLSTDDGDVYEPDKALLTAVCPREDAERIRQLIHDDCRRRVGNAVAAARVSGLYEIDVVTTVARYVPVTLGHHYLGVPVASATGPFELTDEMLDYYGAPIPGPDGRPAPTEVTAPDGSTVSVPSTALGRDDGVIPDEPRMYQWIKAAFHHFFNNVQKDPLVAGRGFRACRELLAYLLREIGIQRDALLVGQPVADTMLTRLLRLQMGQAVPGLTPPDPLDPRLVSDLRIAENVMGTIVGAVAGQEEATCRVIDSLIRLREGEFRTTGAQARYGSFDEARQLALDALAGRKNAGQARARLYEYFQEALRLQPQGEVLLRTCARDGSRIADGPPMRAGTLVFAAHGSAMKDVPEPEAFVLGRPREHYLQYGWARHTCLGQYVSPVIIVETMIALLALDGLRRPSPREGESAFPFERRFGRLQLDDQNLYATSFVLAFDDGADTKRFWPGG